MAMIVLGVFVETTFLAGPAFAISTTKRQRSLALASAQGAGPADLRRQMLAFALVLSTAASVLAGVLGVGAGTAMAAYLRRRNPGNVLPLEVPWLPLAGICVLAVGAATLAAWWPARAVTQLDTISVLRGRSVSRPVRRGIPVVGAVLILAGAGLAVAGIRILNGGEYALVAAAASTFFGMVLLIPLVLFRLGRLADRLPLAARLATRDATRQRGRSVPAVAAIVASVALVTGLSTVVFTSEATDRRNYDQTHPAGVGTVSLQQWDEATQTDRILDVSEVEPLVLAGLDDPQIWSIGMASSSPETSAGQDVEEGTELPVWALYPTDCGAGDVSLNPYADACSITAGTLGDVFMQRVVVVPPDVVRLTRGIDADAAEAVIDGAVLLSTESSPGALVHTVTDVPTVAGKVRVGPQADSLEAVGTLSTGTVKGYFINGSESRQSLDSWGAAALMTPDTAADLGLGTTPSGLVVQLPDRPISQAEEDGIGAALSDVDLYFYVERGAEAQASVESYVWFVTAVLGLIALAATIIVTALTTTDSARDSAVLSAIGGTNRLRRRWAASYAAVISTLGLGLGSVVGLAMGAACAIWTIRGSSGTEFDGSSIIGLSALVLPWPVLGALLALPLLGAAVAWITVRKAPALIRTTI
ncbi:MAG: FtsX-like permease family protein [Ornithinimicrobium sp.]